MTQPKPDQPASRPRRAICRVQLVSGPHRWSFAFEGRDAPVVIRRLAELAADHAAPLSPEEASEVARRVELLSDPASSVR